VSGRAHPAVCDDESTVENSQQQQRQDEAEQIVGNVEIDELIERIVTQFSPH